MNADEVTKDDYKFLFEFLFVIFFLAVVFSIAFGTYNQVSRDIIIDSSFFTAFGLTGICLVGWAWFMRNED